MSVLMEVAHFKIAHMAEVVVVVEEQVVTVILQELMVIRVVLVADQVR
jgi:hypothetical protein